MDEIIGMQCLLPSLCVKSERLTLVPFLLLRRKSKTRVPHKHTSIPHKHISSPISDSICFHVDTTMHNYFQEYE